MIHIYSIKEIIEASDHILKSSSKSGDILFTGNKDIEKKKEVNVSKDKPVILSNADSKNIIPNDIEKIILEAERSQLKEKEIKNNLAENNEKQNSLVKDEISSKELIEDLYKIFGKKIKKNTIKVILELRKDIILLTKNITTLKENKRQIEKTNKELNENIYNLKDMEENLQKNLKQSINGFNQINHQNKSLKLNVSTLEENFLDSQIRLSESIESNKKLDNNLHRGKEDFNSLNKKHQNLKANVNTLEENLLDNQKKLSESIESNKQLKNLNQALNQQLSVLKDNELTLTSKIKKLESHIFTNNTLEVELERKNKTLEKDNIELQGKLNSVGNIDKYLQEINELKLKNKDLENTIEQLKSYEDNNDQNLNIIKELENKIKYYQEENIRISNHLYEANKRFDIVKSEIEVLQNQRSSLVAKINSVNEVIGNSKVVTNVFKNSQSEIIEVNVQDPLKKKETKKLDIDEEITNIFKMK